MKYSLCLIFFLFSFCLSAQIAGIVSAKLQISGILNGERIAWNHDKSNFSIDKNTGDFSAYVVIDDFEIDESASEFEEDKEKGLYKILVFSGNLPIEKIVENQNETIKINEEVFLEYNNLETSSYFDFTILSLPTKGFSILGYGTVNHVDLEVESLENLDPELTVIWSIVGF